MTWLKTAWTGDPNSTCNRCGHDEGQHEDNPDVGCEGWPVHGPGYCPGCGDYDPGRSKCSSCKMKFDPRGRKFPYPVCGCKEVDFSRSASVKQADSLSESNCAHCLGVRFVPDQQTGDSIPCPECNPDGDLPAGPNPDNPTVAAAGEEPGNLIGDLQLFMEGFEVDQSDPGDRHAELNQLLGKASQTMQPQDIDNAFNEMASFLELFEDEHEMQLRQRIDDYFSANQSGGGQGDWRDDRAEDITHDPDRPDAPGR